jgi:hypothetical protein
MEHRGDGHLAWRVLALVGLLVLAGCSSAGDSSPKKGGDQSTGPKTPSEAAGPSPASPVEQAPVLRTTRFQTPSRNIHCESFPASLLCVTDYRLAPEPSHDFCPVDWIGLFIQTGEHAGPACAGDLEVSLEPAEVLQYGQTWALNGVTCEVEKTGLTCQDDIGNGFTVAMAGWSLLGKEAAATAAFPALRNMIRNRAADDASGHVASVSPPVLRAGDGCGELQEAFVPVELTVGGSVVYTACFVSGTWAITAGPLFPD